MGHICLLKSNLSSYHPFLPIEFYEFPDHYNVYFPCAYFQFTLKYQSLSLISKTMHTDYINEIKYAGKNRIRPESFMIHNLFLHTLKVKTKSNMR